jgi:hypothetical protein
MTLKWEYLVAWHERSWTQHGEKTTWKETLKLQAPGKAEIQEVDHWQWADLFTALGAQGWELVSETVLSTVATKSGTGEPVRVRYIFKRAP